MALITFPNFPTPKASLKFGAATSDRVQLAVSTTLDNVHTATDLGWVYPTTFTAGRFLWSKGAPSKRLAILASTGTLEGFVSFSTTNKRRTTTTQLVLNTWQFVANSYQATTDQTLDHIYIGDLTTPAVEAAYAAGTAGVGTISTSTLAWAFGNNSAASPILAFQGSIAFFAHYRHQLSLEEVRMAQIDPWSIGDCDVFMVAADNGMGAVYNMAQNYPFHGTITGATLDLNIPPVLWGPRVRGWRERQLYRKPAIAGGPVLQDLAHRAVHQMMMAR